MGEGVKCLGIEGRSVTETEEYARRLVIAYAVLLEEASAPSTYEPKMEYSYAPEWGCWSLAYGILGLMMAGFCFVGWFLLTF
jgi:hypothetical protein